MLLNMVLNIIQIIITLMLLSIVIGLIKRIKVLERESVRCRQEQQQFMEYQKKWDSTIKKAIQEKGLDK